jgi:hypothetical protein
MHLGTDPSGALVHLDPDSLTRHAVCVGMTGSGKTGLWGVSDRPCEPVLLRPDLTASLRR